VPSDQPRIIEGDLSAGDLRFACVAARFNDFVVEPLIQGAVETLKRHGVLEAQIDIVRVPGAFEIPLVVRKLALSGRYERIDRARCGDTRRYAAFRLCGGRVRARSCAGRARMCAAGRVRRADDRHVEQATDRAGGKDGNKGADAALTAIEMANLLRRLEP
jgi:6,7-dimethyl-8-ribityllumazine synthase